MKRNKTFQHEDYPIKKSLRRGSGAPKSYAEPDQQFQANELQLHKDKQPSRETIFEHKNWTLKQKVKLVVFFSYYQNLPDWNSQRRSIYLYKNMSQFLKNQRTPQQCKNMHSLLKRKFSTLPQIIDLIENELQHEEAFHRLLLKYQKQIVHYEKQHQLKDSIYEGEYFPLSSRRGTSKQQNQKMKMTNNDFQINLGAEDINLGNRVVFPAEFGLKRAQLIQKCNFYFKEWLMCNHVLQKKRQQSSTNF